MNETPTKLSMTDLYNKTSGWESVTVSESRPFLKLIQALSAEVNTMKEDHAQKKVEGATVGSIIATKTRELAYQTGGTPLQFIYIRDCKVWEEKKGPKADAEVVARFFDPSILVTECERRDNPDGKGFKIIRKSSGNIVVDVVYVQGLYKTKSGAWEEVFIAMYGTSLPVHRKWVELMKARRVGGTPLPVYSAIWGIGSKLNRNDANAWFTYDVSFVSNVPEEFEGIETLAALLNNQNSLTDSLGKGKQKQSHNLLADGDAIEV